MEKILTKFKQAILVFVLGVLMIVLALSVIELIILGIEQLLSPPRFLLDITQLTEIFSFVLMLVIGLELIESIEREQLSIINVKVL